MDVDELLNLALKYNVDFSKYSFDDLVRGVKIEYEHGLVNPITNVTNDDLESTFKIALAHLYEFPNYYNSEYGLSVFENFLKEKESNK